jgi:MacB-like periplasmic core domain
VARPLEGRDPDELVNVSLRLQSGATTARFSYLDYDAYRTGLRSFSGVIAFSIDQLRLTDAGGAPRQRSQENGTLIGRLGLAMPSPSRTEIASTFIVSENYFSVLGVAPDRGRAFHAFSLSELAASSSVMISDNYWRQRFAGDPVVLGKSIRLNGAAFTIVGITPADFTGTSIVVPNVWLPLSLQPLVHPGSACCTTGRSRAAACGVVSRRASAWTWRRPRRPCWPLDCARCTTPTPTCIGG